MSIGVFPSGAPPALEIAQIFFPGLNPAGGVDTEVAGEEARWYQEPVTSVTVAIWLRCNKGKFSDHSFTYVDDVTARCLHMLADAL